MRFTFLIKLFFEWGQEVGEEDEGREDSWRPQQWAQRPCHPFWECWALLQHPSPAGDQAETRPPGGRGGGWRTVGGDGPRPAPPAEHLGRCPGSGALLAWPKLTIGGRRRLPPRPLRSPGRSIALGGSAAHGHTHHLSCCPARLLACSAQGDTIHVRAPKPGSGSPRSWLGPAPGGREPEPAPSGASVPGRPRLWSSWRLRGELGTMVPATWTFPWSDILPTFPSRFFWALKLNGTVKNPRHLKLGLWMSWNP